MQTPEKDRMQQALKERAALEKGCALEFALDRKWRQAGQAYLSQGIKFQPLPVETFGGWHQQAINVISKIGLQLARHQGSDESEVKKHLFEGLSILLMRSNAALILSRSPDFAPSNIDGVVDS